MKKIILCLLIATISTAQLGVIGYAAEQTAVNIASQTEQKSAVKMTIDDAVIYALENSDAIKVSQSSFDQQKTLLDEAKQNYAKMQDKASISNQVYLVKSGYYMRMQQVSYNVAERALKDAKYNLETSVYTNFYTYLSNVKKTEFAKEGLSEANKRLAEAKLMKEKGMISEYDIQSFELSCFQAENNVKKAIRNESYSLAQFKISIGFPINDDLQVVGEFNRVEKIDIPLEQAISMIDTNTHTILNAKESLALNEELYELYKKWYFPHEYTYQNQEKAYKTALANYKSLNSSMVLPVIAAYNSMMDVYENIDYTDMLLDNTSKSIEILSLKYKMESALVRDLIESEQSYAELKNNIVDLELRAMLAGRAYKHSFDQINV